MKKQASKWITISEESSSEPALSSPQPSDSWFKRAKDWFNGDLQPKKTIQKEEVKTAVLNLQETLSEDDVIKHKWFWATGFVAVMIFTALLLAPEELTAQIKSLIPGNLFSEKLDQTIENYDGIDLLPPPPGSAQYIAEQEAAAAAQQAFQGGASGDQVVQASSEAVNVMVDPISVQVDPVQSSTQTQNPSDSNTFPAAPSDSTVLNSAQTPTPTQESSQTQDAALAAQQALIEKLTKDLAAFEQQSQVQSQQLAGTQNLYPAATTSNPGLQTSQILGQQPGIGVTQPVNSLQTFPVNTSVQNTSTTTYRLNPYKVAVTPQQVLAQNQGKWNMPQASGLSMGNPEAQQVQANILASNVQLGQVKAVPESGPMDLIWVALALGLFVGLRTLKRRI